MDPRFPKTLITGGNGMVGSYVDFGIKTDRTTLDVTDLKAVLAVAKKIKPKVILHLAALTNLTDGEKNPLNAYRVNTVGTYNMAVAARTVKAKLVYISTTGIFDGLKKSPYIESDIPNPQDHYGHSKYAGELIVQSMLKNYIIARTCWVFGGGSDVDKKFVARIISQLKNPETTEINALNDTKGSPTYAKDLVETIKKLIAKNAKGVFHLTNAGSCSRYDIAKTIVETLKPSVRVTGVKSDYLGPETRRIANESSVSRLNPMRPWLEALREYLLTEWPKF
ncbi:MAG: NAD(P)-dependent oxidoreductase [bacterium]|nr:NAD(P)-dependent oxidoreductase [bacterium]